MRTLRLILWSRGVRLCRLRWGGGKDGARLFRALKADKLVPMHYESWGHFTQFGEELKQVFEEEGISEKVCWLKGGEAVSIF